MSSRRPVPLLARLLAGAAAREARPALLSRGFAASAAASSSSSSGEAVALPRGAASSAAVLLRLPTRPFGATARLPADLVRSLLKSGTASTSPPARLGVVREAFAAHDAAPRPLSSLVAPLPPGASPAVALLCDTQSDPAQRLVVDEYVPASDGSYALERVATDMAEFLRRQRVAAALVPDVQKAAAGASSSNACVSARRVTGRQSTNRVLMVAPTAFGFNEQAAQDNSFMHDESGGGGGKGGDGSNGNDGPTSLTRQVLREYAGLYRALADGAGVDVTLYQHDLAHGTPDAVFPNNWFSTHAAGEGASAGGGGAGAGGAGVPAPTMVLYPMKCPNRAAERRPEIIEAVRHLGGYDRVVDLTAEEKRGGGGGGTTPPRFFEGTGVLVPDRVNGVAYVNVSERADAALAERWLDQLGGYKEVVAFKSTDARGARVYHTNVMMAVGTGVAIVCDESVADAKERQHLLSKLSKHHEVVRISRSQMDRLCGNALEVADWRGLPVMAMSTQAHDAFTEEQRRAMLRHCAALVHSPIDTLERVGGGGVRCSLAELF